MPMNILIVDDSEVFCLMVGRDLLKKGFREIKTDVYGNNDKTVYIAKDYESARALLDSLSEHHLDFSAVFLDWHLSPGDRVEGKDGAQLAVMAFDETNQPLKPAVYCISAEGKEMLALVRSLVRPAVTDERLVLLHFMEVPGKIVGLT